MVPMTLEQYFAGLLWLGLLVAGGITLIGVCVWWLCSALKRRALPRRWEIGIGLLLIGTVSAAFGLSWLLLLRLDPFNQARFDRQAWVAAPGDRGPMTSDLLRRHLKKGTGRQEVLALLGKPDQRKTHQGKPLVEGAGSERTREILRYSLGNWSGLRMDTDYLDLAFDESGRLIGAWVWQS
ncbi:MAG: hypothetical protein K0Q72_909 [Armatimonadetes bacterium]|jgi:hypothetical protein|nr:hypothetical protein [Armatimonadota bacterium]